MIITKTPVRFSLIGGGTDLPVFWQNHIPSQFISITLDSYVYVTRRTRSVPEQEIMHSDGGVEVVSNANDIENPLIRETLMHIHGDVLQSYIMDDSYSIVSDVTGRGSGLGVSSALIVGLLRTCGCFGATGTEHFYYGDLLSDATDIEIKRLGKRIGWQDHIAAIWGGLRWYKIFVDGCVTSIDLSTHGYWLAKHLMAFRIGERTMTTHDVIMDSHAGMLENFEARLPALLNTVPMVPNMAAAIMSGDLGEIAKYMRSGWDLKIRSHSLGDSPVLEIYHAGIRAGALAGKMAGSVSRGAGHMFFLVQREKRQAVRKAMGEFDLEDHELHLGFERYGSRRRAV